MNRIAVRLAAVSFFVLAALCWMAGQSPENCAIRAAAGAVGIYIIVRLGLRLAVSILVDAVIKNSRNSREARTDQ